MNDEDYIYLRTLPNYKIIEKNYTLFRGRVLKFLLILTGLRTYKEILEKWNGFTIQELIYLEYE